MGQFRPGQARAQNGPKTAPGGSETGTETEWGPVSPLMDIIHACNARAVVSSCLVSFLPVKGVCWPNLGQFASSLHPVVRNRNWLYLGLDEPNRDSDSTFPLCQTPLSVVFTLGLGPYALLDVVFACWVPV